jgi:hypothetical protein
MGGSHHKDAGTKYPIKSFLWGNLTTTDLYKNQEQNGRTRSRGCVADPRNTTLEETSWGYRRIEALLREIRAQKGFERTWMDNKGILSSTNATI